MMVVGVGVALWVSKPVLAIEPANPNANLQTRKVLNYLNDLPNRGGNRVISSQHLRAAQGFANDYDLYIESLHQLTGNYVGMIGGTIGQQYWGNTESKVEAFTQGVTEYWNAGGLVAYDHHAPNPWTGGTSWDLTNRNLGELLDQNSQIYPVWKAELDRVAKHFNDLQQAGVVVLWRPFHEMNFMNCFWWDMGAVLKDHPEQGAEVWKQMWRQMFDYFTYQKGLNNILWVYAAADVANTYWNPPLLVYPGDDYVDIVALDLYSDSQTIRSDSYEQLTGVGKPLGLAEVGPASILDGSWNNATIINSIKTKYPKVVYFQNWHSWTGAKVAIIDNQNASELLNDSWVVNRNEVDWESMPPFEVSPTPTSNPNEVIIDNEDAGFSYFTASGGDAWVRYPDTGTVDSQHYNGSHYYNVLIGGGDTARWDFTVGKPGIYDVDGWWLAKDYRPTDVPYVVNYAGGSETVRVNQQANGGQWNLLGRHYFVDQGWVEVSDRASNGRDVVADAVRLVYQGPGWKYLMNNWLGSNGDGNGDGKVNSWDWTTIINLPLPSQINAQTGNQ